MTKAGVQQRVRGRRNEVIGHVVSDKMDKTISVKVYWSVKHRQYGKVVRRMTTCRAHDEKNLAQIGDKVLIYETRALSKTKRWKLVKVIESVEKDQKDLLS